MLHLSGTDCHISNSMPFQSSTNKRLRSRDLILFHFANIEKTQVVENMNSHKRKRDVCGYINLG